MLEKASCRRYEWEDKEINIATTLYNNRKLAIRIYGEDYEKRVTEYIRAVLYFMEMSNKPVLETLSIIMRGDKFNESSTGNQMLFIAAAVEIGVESEIYKVTLAERNGSNATREVTDANKQG